MDVFKNIDNPNVSLIQYIKSHPRFESEFLWMSNTTEEKLIALLENNKTSIARKLRDFVKSIPSLREEHREKRRLEFEPKRTEIYEIAWHPSRFKEWCLDTETLHGISLRWGVV